MKTVSKSFLRKMYKLNAGEVIICSHISHPSCSGNKAIPVKFSAWLIGDRLYIKGNYESISKEVELPVTAKMLGDFCKQYDSYFS